ncbi:MAG: hypothetical protein DRI56_07490 [Chloroflexota bacterium]|nr:MAG: hypothetical protein DRI56_07490 [Chloroflexota bacterium]
MYHFPGICDKKTIGLLHFIAQHPLGKLCAAKNLGVGIELAPILLGECEGVPLSHWADARVRPYILWMCSPHLKFIISFDAISLKQKRPSDLHPMAFHVLYF